MEDAVDRVPGRSKLRVVNARFSAMASHHLFDAAFCNVASRWEKGSNHASRRRSPAAQGRPRTNRSDRDPATTLDPAERNFPGIDPWSIFNAQWSVLDERQHVDQLEKARAAMEAHRRRVTELGRGPLAEQRNESLLLTGAG